jgi:hypothetical protein
MKPYVAELHTKNKTKQKNKPTRISTAYKRCITQTTSVSFDTNLLAKDEIL